MNWKSHHSLLVILGTISAMFSALLIGHAHVGSIEGFQSYLNGAALYSPAVIIDRESLDENTELTLRFSVQNLSGHAIHVYGLADTCNCKLVGIPVDIAPKESAAISISAPGMELAEGFERELKYLPASNPVYLRVRVR